MKTSCLLLVLLVTACATDSPTSTGGGGSGQLPGTVTIGETPSTLHVSQSLQLSAEVRDHAGKLVPSAMVDWNTDRSAVAIVNAQGLLYAVGTGTVTVLAASGGDTASRQLTVLSIAPETISLAAPSDTVHVGDSFPMNVQVYATGNFPLPQAQVQWEVDQPAIASISYAGLVRAIAPGRVAVTAHSGNARATRYLTVLPPVPASITVWIGMDTTYPGWSQQAGVSVLSTAGQPMSAGPVSWSSSEPSVATISANGLLQAIAPGVTRITAVMGSISASRAVTVVTYPSLTPPGPPLPAIGMIAFLRVTGTDSTIEVRREDGTLVHSAHPLIPLKTPNTATAPSIALSGDGNRVAYDCIQGVCLLDLLNNEVTVVPPDCCTGGVLLSEPTWSRDDGELVVRYQNSAVATWGIAASQLVPRYTTFYVERPKPSPDGQVVIYECDSAKQYDPLSDLCIIWPNGSIDTYRTNANALSWNPVDGSLAYMRDAAYGSGQRKLVVEPLQPDPLLNGGSVAGYDGFDDVTETAWSPDGKHLALVRNGEIWIVGMPGAGSAVRFASVPGSKVSGISWR